MRADGPRIASGDVGLRNPITGIAGCCARAASGHAAAAPPSRLTNSRRLMPGMGSLPGAAAYHSSRNRRVQAV